MMEELLKLREMTEHLESTDYINDPTIEWEYALNSIPYPIFIMNLNKNIKFANSALVTLLRVESYKEVLGKKCYDIIGCRQLCGGTPFFDEKVLHFDNFNTWFSVVHSPVFDKMEELLGYTVILRPVATNRSFKQVTRI